MTGLLGECENPADHIGRMMDLRRFILTSLRSGGLVYLIVLLTWGGLIVFFGSHSDSRWGQLGIGAVLAPIPLLFVFLLILAYGEWLSKEIRAFRLESRVWVEEQFSRLQKFLFVLVAIGFLTLLVAILDDQSYHQIKETLITIRGWELLRNFLIAVVLLVSLSAVSLCAYNIFLKRKRKQLGRELNRIFEELKSRKDS